MKKKVLIVEDDVMIADTLNYFMEDFGYEIVNTCVSAAPAVNIARSCDLDLILLDIMLVGHETGLDAAYIIREFSKVPIIFVTAYMPEEWERKVKIDNISVLKKPFTVEELAEALNKIEYSGCREKSI